MLPYRPLSRVAGRVPKQLHPVTSPEFSLGVGLGLKLGHLNYTHVGSLQSSRSRLHGSLHSGLHSGPQYRGLEILRKGAKERVRERDRNINNSFTQSLSLFFNYQSVFCRDQQPQLLFGRHNFLHLVDMFLVLLLNTFATLVLLLAEYVPPPLSLRLLHLSVTSIYGHLRQGEYKGCDYIRYSI